MNIELTGKRALVCGSSQGIGKAIAIELAALGAEVILLARNADGLEQVKAALGTEHNQQHHVLVADFSQPVGLKAALDEYLPQASPVHILVNNTGGPAPGPAYSATSDAYLAAFSQHLLCNQMLVQAVVEGMKAAGYGRIINIISTSIKQPIKGLGVSNTIRGAVANWAKTLSGELGPFGITVNNVLPGATSTARLAVIIENKARRQNTSVAEVEAEEKAAIPLGRFAEPQELAWAVAFLASPAAAYITGINLPVDGGRTECL
jgi:Dehydrogenases with different specificities (related to short-chain alcohol dehydrogenases)